MYTNVNEAIYQGEVDPHFATKAIHLGQDIDFEGSTNVPIFTTSTYRQKEPGKASKYVYGRYGNPSRNSLEESIAKLEDGKHGFCFASGTAALNGIVHLLKVGDHVICREDIYGGTVTYFAEVAPRLGIDVSFIDMSNLDNVRNTIKNNTMMIWIESLANPLMQLTDIAGVKKIIDESKKDIIFVVDNTFMTPYFQRPLNLGADIVMESLSKYINGHGDVIMGAVITNHEHLVEKFRFIQKSVGAIPAPIDCFMVQRGIKTLAIRMREHMKNGITVAKFLENHPCVEKVLHPGLPSHPQHKLSLKQTSGTSGMLSFYLKGAGGLEQARKFINSLKVFTHAGSLGGCDSLVEIPALLSHISMPPEQLQRLGITNSLIRMSVGIESLDDLLKDLDEALRIAG